MGGRVGDSLRDAGFVPVFWGVGASWLVVKKFEVALVFRVAKAVGVRVVSPARGGDTERKAL